MERMGLGLREARATVEAAAGKVTSAAADAKHSIVAAGLIAVIALGVALGALTLAIAALAASGRPAVAR